MIKIIRERRKSITIKVDDSLDIIVKAPYGISEQRIYELVEEKQHFINQAIDRQEEKKQAKNWFANKKILFLGRDRTIIIKKTTKQIMQVSLEEDKIYVMTALEQDAAIKDALEKWMKAYLSQIIIEFTNKYCERIGCQYNKITIRKQKTRWGSCSSKGNLSYNIKLICTPLEVIEYVVLHEVIHLKHFDHSKEFWRAVEGIMPDYKKYQGYLREYGNSLEI